MIVALLSFLSIFTSAAVFLSMPYQQSRLHFVEAPRSEFHAAAPYDRAYVIRRGADFGRQANFDEMARIAGVEAENFEGADETYLDPVELEQAGEIHWDIRDRLLADPGIWGKHACTLSHNRLWRQIENESSMEVFLVLEDDSQIPATFHKKLRHALQDAPSDWDVLYLNHNRLFGNVVGDGVWLQPEAHVAHGTNGFAHAYLIRLQGLQRMLKVQHPIWYWWAHDVNLRANFGMFSAYFLVEVLVPKLLRDDQLMLNRTHAAADAIGPNATPLAVGLPIVPNSSLQMQQQALSEPEVSPGVVTPLYDQAFVISRRVDVERQENISKAAAAAGVRFRVIEATDKDTLDPRELEKAGEVTKVIRDKMLNNSQTWGKYACTVSHNRLWRALENEIPSKTFLIFEDDSQIPLEFHAKLRHALRHVPSDWDFLYLNHNKLLGKVVGNGLWAWPEITFAKGTNSLTNAYMVRPEGLKRMLTFQHPIWYPWSNDANMRMHLGMFEGYFLIEALVPQAGESVRKNATVKAAEAPADRPTKGNKGMA